MAFVSKQFNAAGSTLKRALIGFYRSVYLLMYYHPLLTRGLYSARLLVYLDYLDEAALNPDQSILCTVYYSTGFISAFVHAALFYKRFLHFCSLRQNKLGNLITTM